MADLFVPKSQIEVISNKIAKKVSADLIANMPKFMANQPRGFITGRGHEGFIRKVVIEYAAIPAAGAPLEVNVGVGADVMVYADYPIDIYYGPTEIPTSIGVLQARYTGVTGKLRFLKNTHLDYGRLIIYYATPSLGMDFSRPKPVDCLTKSVGASVVGGWAAGASTETVVGAGAGVVAPIEAMYYRCISLWRESGSVDGVRILETESGGGFTLYQKFVETPGDHFNWYIENPIRCSSRHQFVFYGSIEAGNTDYEYGMEFHVI